MTMTISNIAENVRRNTRRALGSRRGKIAQIAAYGMTAYKKAA